MGAKQNIPMAGDAVKRMARFKGTPRVMGEANVSSPGPAGRQEMYANRPGIISGPGFRQGLMNRQRPNF